MADVSTVVDGYIAMWNETTPDARRAIIAATWGGDASYTDPLMSGAGAAGIDATVADDGRLRSVTGFLDPGAPGE